MEKGREESELSAPPGTAVAVVTEAATEAQKAQLRCGAQQGSRCNGRCASEPPRLSGVTGTADAAVAGTEDAAVTCMQHTQQQCSRRQQTGILPSPASPHVWSKSSQQAHSGAAHQGYFQWFIPRGTFRLQGNNFIFCLINLKLLKEVPCFHWFQEPIIMHTKLSFSMVVFQKDFCHGT